MRKSLLWVVGGGLALAASALLAIVFWPSSTPYEDTGRDLSKLEGNVDRGAYVARLSGCIACHTDFKKGGKVLAGGAGISTDFGTFFPPNITPDKADGVGSWSLGEFTAALREGVGKEGQHLFPSFPFAFYKHMKDQDVVDLWAAVQSVPPETGGRKDHDLAFPFNVRAGVTLWKKMFFREATLKEVPSRSDGWNRGRYLARGLAHCGACHTPRNILGGRETDQRFAGGVGPGKEKIPAITREALGKNEWSADDFVYALTTGIKPDGDVLGGSMAEVVKDGTRFWSNSDLNALAEYVFSGDLE